MSSVAAVASPTGRQGRCDQWPNCYHIKAHYLSNCQGCHLRFNKEDCIVYIKCGWTHVECPGKSEQERGLVSLEKDYNKSVDYGTSYLARITMGKGQCLSLPSHPHYAVRPLQIESDFDAEADNTVKPMQVTQEECQKQGTTSSSVPQDYWDDYDEESDFEYDNASPTKKTKYANQSTEVTALSTYHADGGKYANEKKTEEQMKILQHSPKRGEVVAVNALAGCGKTTTIALLCDKVRKEHPDRKIDYLVYNKSIESEAMQSKKFPKENMEIRTTHAYVLRHYFGVANMHQVKPARDYTLMSIIDELDLMADCKRIFKNTLPAGAKGDRVLKRQINTIARDIIKTLNTYQASDEPNVKEYHVPSRARPNTISGAKSNSRSKWRQYVKIGHYVRWATKVFGEVHQKCQDLKHGRVNTSAIEITFEGYMKVAQLEQLHIDSDYIFIDEAQDMTACQADLFWGQHQRNDKIIYLFGDKYQQIYRFRGASKAFRGMVDNSKYKFSLTGSFRFGVNIASCATCVLKAFGGEELFGRSNNDGAVEEFIEDGEQPSMKRGVVLCRTQNGIYRYLFSNRPRRWCHIGGKRNIPESPEPWKLSLEKFVKYQLKLQKDEEEERQNESNSEPESDEDESGSDEDSVEVVPEFDHKGESFGSLEEIFEYAQEEDVELGKAANLLMFLVSKKKPLADFYFDLRNSYHPMNKAKPPEEYDGVIVDTVHKAKGLEWNSPVLIYDDFNFELISSAVLNEYKQQDEANILYVAITRAKQHLLLSSKAKECLQLLSRLVHVKMELPAMLSLHLCKNMFHDWKDSWESFKRRNDMTIKSTADVPLPPNWDDEIYPIALHPHMRVSRQRWYLQTYLRAYHSDKFMSAFQGRKVAARVWSELKDIAEEITRKCTELLAALRDVDDPDGYNS